MSCKRRKYNDQVVKEPSYIVYSFFSHEDYWLIYVATPLELGLTDLKLLQYEINKAQTKNLHPEQGRNRFLENLVTT